MRAPTGTRSAPDGLVVMAYLLSWASAPNSAKRAWETSAAQISEQFGWGGNRERAQRAIDAAIEAGRLLMRKYVRDGVELVAPTRLCRMRGRPALHRRRGASVVGADRVAFQSSEHGQARDMTRASCTISVHDGGRHLARFRCMTAAGILHGLGCKIGAQTLHRSSARQLAPTGVQHRTTYLRTTEPVMHMRARRTISSVRNLATALT